MNVLYCFPSHLQTACSGGSVWVRMMHWPAPWTLACYSSSGSAGPATTSAMTQRYKQAAAAAGAYCVPPYAWRPLSLRGLAERHGKHLDRANHPWPMSVPGHMYCACRCCKCHAACHVNVLWQCCGMDSPLNPPLRIHCAGVLPLHRATPYSWSGWASWMGAASRRRVCPMRTSWPTTCGRWSSWGGW